MGCVWSQHTKKTSACNAIVSYAVVGKNLNLISHILCECDALSTLGYFCLGSDKLDTEFIRKTHPRLILAFTKAAGLGE